MEPDVPQVVDRAQVALRDLAAGADGGHASAAASLREVEAALATIPSARGTLGPLIGQLRSAMKVAEKGEEVRWVGVGGGHLAIGHRPKLKAVSSLRRQKATHLLTLLHEGEGAAEIGSAAKAASLEWLWLPLENADVPPDERRSDIEEIFRQVAAILRTGGRVFVHCSAGIHRTGMITYGLLRSLGLNPLAARDTLALLRNETRDSVGDERLSWGDQFGTSSE